VLNVYRRIIETGGRVGYGCLFAVGGDDAKGLLLLLLAIGIITYDGIGNGKWYSYLSLERVVRIRIVFFLPEVVGDIQSATAAKFKIAIFTSRFLLLSWRFGLFSQEFRTISRTIFARISEKCCHVAGARDQ
jgi:hypothetical protein